MSLAANLDREVNQLIYQNLNEEVSPWLMTPDVTESVSKQTLGTLKAFKGGLSTTSYYEGTRYYADYTQHSESDYHAHSDDGAGYDNSYYSVSSYSDEGYSVYVESDHSAYGVGYYNYSDYSCYSCYYDYYNYSRTDIYFYWTKNNDGTTKLTNTETGLISDFAMAVQANVLIGLLNTHAGTSIATVSTNTPFKVAKYNELATALSMPTLPANALITAQQFYDLQSTFNAKGYYVTG